MRRCAICGFEDVSMDLCNKCYREYCRDEEGNLIKPKKAAGRKAISYYPIWIQELIRMEQHNRYIDRHLVYIEFDEEYEEEYL